jgi:hypothetical protein
VHSQSPSLEAALGAFRRYVLTRRSGTVREPAVAQRLIQACADALVRGTDAKPPIDLFPLAEWLSVEVRFRDANETGHLGGLVPVPGGFCAYVYGQTICAVGGLVGHSHASTLTRRGRFTLAHELGHAAFYTRPNENARPVRLVPVGSSGRDHWWEEGLCHAFARALLMPVSAQALVPGDPSPRALVGASKQFDISKEAAVRRILYDWGCWQAAVLVNIEFSGQQKRISIYRGRDRRKRDSKGLTRIALEQSVASSTTPIEAARMLRAMHGVPVDQFLIGSLSVWALCS